MRFVFLLVLGSVTGGCAAVGAVPRPFPTPGGPSSHEPARPAPAPAPGTERSLDGDAVAGTALALRGVPYRRGGSDPSGFDCSGLVYYVFGHHGLMLPRTVQLQYRAGMSVSNEQGMQPGDLVFFNITGSGPSHVGIMIGADAFVHAPNSAGDVRVERLESRYWSDRFLGARRVH